MPGWSDNPISFFSQVLMHIWIFNPFDELPGEGPEQRYGCLARLLAERGHEVLWVSADFHHRLKTRRNPSRLSLRGYEIRMMKSPSYSRNLSVRRLWAHACWGRRVVRDLHREVEAGELRKPDLILASLPPLDGVAAALRCGTLFGCEVVADFMDDWPRTWLQALPHHPAARRMGQLLLTPWSLWLRHLLRQVDRVGAQSRRYAERAKALGASGDAHVCYLGSYPRLAPDADGPGAPPENGHAEGHDPLRLMYLGAMGRIYDIENVLQAAVLSKRKNLPWHWTLAGGDPEGRWQCRATELEVTDVVDFPGYVTGVDLDRLLCSADLGLVPMDPRSGVAVPYKAAEYLSAGLGILSTLPGELAVLLERSGAGISIPHGNAEALVRAAEALTGTAEKRRRVRNAAYALFADAFDKTRIYPRYVEWLCLGMREKGYGIKDTGYD